MSNAFFSSVSSVIQVLIAGVLTYAALVLFLRIAGKRTLAKLNAFDLVVTVALGSTLATVLLSRTVPLVDGIAAFVTLIVLQFVVAWLGVRAKWFRDLVTSEPTLLVRDGVLLEEAMQRERIDHDEVLAAIRQGGIVAMRDVRAVVLERDGSLSVLRRTDDPVDETSLADVPGLGRKARV